MMLTPDLLARHPIISDQVDPGELGALLGRLERVLHAGVPGDVVEFGCYVGTTTLFIRRLLDAYASDKSLHVYDSFAGLPEKDARDRSPAGEQFQAGELSATKKELIMNFRKAHLRPPIIHKGWFADIAAGDVPASIAFAFLDGDYYHSVRDSLKLIWPKLAAGAVVVIDDYANEALPGARLATDEWLRQHPARLQVIHSLAVIELD